MYTINEANRTVESVDVWCIEDVCMQEELLDLERFTYVLTDDDRWKILKRVAQEANSWDIEINVDRIEANIIDYLKQKNI